MVGSGPYRFLPDERVSGSRAVYRRFEGYVPRGSGVAKFHRRSQDRHGRADRVAYHSGCGDGGRGLAGGRGGLVGTAHSRPAAAAAQESRDHHGDHRPRRKYRHHAGEQPVSAVRQSGDQARAAGGDQPGGFHAGGGGRGPADVAHRRRRVPARHAVGEQRRDGGVLRQSGLRPRQAQTSRRRAIAARRSRSWPPPISRRSTRCAR